ncbi:hypothetical protein TSOC_010473 [Tetrabaena socialis]|uniref:Uncharacterized protein n=1 Tax=Tetrabaena socialis TaxID=47790 RepID=A0A2J7ZT64_9CHLO|nr:hypothetical protein TSOC_010473 [Tetrabaena socialis]|eukprot:PNH03459.1 hypothetical protein TSOC_010473 [Tetrabaena socialis]
MAKPGNSGPFVLTLDPEIRLPISSVQSQPQRPIASSPPDPASQAPSPLRKTNSRRSRGSAPSSGRSVTGNLHDHTRRPTGALGEIVMHTP